MPPNITVLLNCKNGTTGKFESITQKLSNGKISRKKIPRACEAGSKTNENSENKTAERSTIAIFTLRNRINVHITIMYKILVNGNAKNSPKTTPEANCSGLALEAMAKMNDRSCLSIQKDIMISIF